MWNGKAFERAMRFILRRRQGWSDAQRRLWDPWLRRRIRAHFRQLAPNVPESVDVLFDDPDFLFDYPWHRHIALEDQAVAPPEVLVFMPTYAPELQIAPGPGLRGAGAVDSYFRIMQRGWRRSFEAPWTYLDAIDSIQHVLSSGVHLVVADFASSPAVRRVLLEHQRAAAMPNYELWFGERESQWRAMNAVLLNKFARGAYEFFVYTTSDVLWTQRAWLSECVLEMNRDWDCLVTYPTVTKVAANVRYQGAPLPRESEAFPVSLANAYCTVFRREFFQAWDFRYPDVFRNCYTEAFMPHMVRALGKTQKVVPRANCSHCEGLDIWYGGPERTDSYGAVAEHASFAPIMQAWQALQRTGPDNQAVQDWLKRHLYTDIATYQSMRYERYAQGERVDD